MAVDKAGQHHVPAEVDALYTLKGAKVGTQASDTAIGDGQGEGAAVGGDGIDENTIKHFRTSLERVPTL